MFVIIVGIIMIAFANFFYVINLNSPGVVVKRTGNGYFDAFLDIYLLGIGEFEDKLEGINNSPNVYLGWFFLIMATFFVLIVFMNMLIAIMGDTFSQVQSIKEENSIMEQANLIKDHIWLLDLKEIFPNKKHIILLTPDVANVKRQLNLKSYINQVQT